MDTDRECGLSRVNHTYAEHQHMITEEIKEHRCSALQQANEKARSIKSRKREHDHIGDTTKTSLEKQLEECIEHGRSRG
jgi:hypothetical protein